MKLLKGCPANLCTSSTFHRICRQQRQRQQQRQQEATVAASLGVGRCGCSKPAVATFKVLVWGAFQPQPGQFAA